MLMGMDEEKLLTSKEVMEILNCKRSKLQQFIIKKKLTLHPEFRNWHFLKSEVYALVQDPIKEAKQSKFILNGKSFENIETLKMFSKTGMCLKK